MRDWVIGVLLCIPCLLSAESDLSAPSSTVNYMVEVPVLSINGAIGPAVSDYLTREITRINTQNQAPLIILTMDTPGGLSASLRDINQSILSSRIPLACLVYPQGARAASAGTYILYACHIAAMAEATTLGAATPVTIGGPATDDKNKQKTSDEPSAMEKKVLNDSIAYIRSLAQLRNRNVEWAELAVKEAATLTAKEALEQNVINLLADTPEQLLVRLDGQIVNVDNSQKRLNLSNSILDHRTPDWRSQFIATITDPNIAYILLLVGIYGLLLEFYSPGMGVAGITGAILLLIGLYALQLLPLNYAGLGLLILGISLLVAESFLPSFGLFGIGGVIAFVIGSIFLIDTEQVYFRVSIELISTLALMSLLFSLFVLGTLWKIRKKTVVTGQESILGAQAIALNSFKKHGFVLMGGERWAARSEHAITAGQVVTVLAITGLVLIVTPNHRGVIQDGTTNNR